MTEYYIGVEAAVRGLTSRAPVTFDAAVAGRALPVLWAAFLTILITSPWLAPGYIFGTDWPGPRQIGWPTAITSSFPLDVVLATLSWVVGGEATGKLFVVGLIFGAAVTAYRAVPAGGFVPRAAAATLYVVNPFVYGRLHYGQLFLLAGYALLPWTAHRIRLLLADPRPITAIVAAVCLVLVGAPSTHLFLVAWVLAGVLALSHVIAAHRKRDYLKRLGPQFVLTVGLTLAGTSYWLIPVLIGRGAAASTLSGIGTGDLFAFAAVPDRHLGLIPNLLGLYGFWAENSGRFASMKGFVPLWPAILAILLAVAAVGAVQAFRERGDRLVAWMAGMLVCALIALALEMGVSHAWTAPLVMWLDAHLAFYRGMRDAGKWAALLALVYSQLFGLGAAALLAWLQTRVGNPNRAEWATGIGAALLLALPLYFGNGLLFGAHGEIRPSQYPVGWYAAERVLAADEHPGRTLFLPWHEYMSFSFVRNENNVVASPAPTFFSVPILVSSNAEVLGLPPPTDPDQVAISSLVRAGDVGRWAEVLAAHGIRYVLVAHELDWSSFGYLDRQPGLVKVGDYGSISLYQVSPP